MIVSLAKQIITKRLSRGPCMKNPQDTRSFLVLKLATKEREVFGCLFLDNRHRVIVFEELFLGTIDGATVHPREVVKRALQLNAAAIVVAHNHPSGIAEPSPADRAITRRLRDALSLVDIRLLDHIIVAGSEATSLAELGLL